MVARLVLDSPVGWLEATALDGRLRSVRFVWDRPAAAAAGEGSAGDPALDALASQLDRYWAGEEIAFELDYDWSIVDGMRADVLRACAAVPYGTTTTYGELARRVGRPGEARAVGGAMRSNPWVLVVPCHRVVGADGALTGYGGGPDRGGRLDVKAALLAHEAEASCPSLFGSALR